METCVVQSCTLHAYLVYLYVTYLEGTATLSAKIVWYSCLSTHSSDPLEWSSWFIFAMCDVGRFWDTHVMCLCASMILNVGSRPWLKRLVTVNGPSPDLGSCWSCMACGTSRTAGTTDGETHSWGPQIEMTWTRRVLYMYVFLSHSRDSSKHQIQLEWGNPSSNHTVILIIMS